MFDKVNNSSLGGRQPQKRNQTSFSSTYQPDSSRRSRGNKPKTVTGLVETTAKKRGLKRTQAQRVMQEQNFNPMENMVAMAQQLENMIAKKIDWWGEPATKTDLKQFQTQYIKLNERLLEYQSSKAPVQICTEDQQAIEEAEAEERAKHIEDVKPEQIETVDKDTPLSITELANAKKNMLKDMEDRF